MVFPEEGWFLMSEVPLQSDSDNASRITSSEFPYTKGADDRPLLRWARPSVEGIHTSISLKVAMLT